MASQNLTINVDRGLVAHGAIMTLLGLLSGYTPLFAKAPTAALEAHVIGTLQGATLFGLAAIWPALGANRRIVRVARGCALVGFYANWIGSQLAAFWSARNMMIVTGVSMPAGATRAMELTVALLLNLSTLIIVMCVLILVALRDNSANAPA
jgi:hypothetical protein